MAPVGTPERLLDGVDALGEGPVWFDEALWWVDIDRCLVHRWSGSEPRLTWQLDRPASAVLPASDGGVLVTTSHGVERLHLDDDARLELLVPIEADLDDTRANDAACDPDGTLFVGTMHVSASPDRGKLYRIVDGYAEVVWQPVTISNGLGWSPDGQNFYYVDTARGSVDVAGRSAAGRPGPRRVLVPPAGAPGVPDGLAVAADGSIWVARWGGGCVGVHAPDGELMGRIPLPARHVTNCAFGPAGSDTLFVTTAADPDHPDGMAGSVFRVPVAVDGLPPTPVDVATLSAPQPGASR